MDKFADLFQFRKLFGLLLEQVLNGFHVVVGGALELLDAFGVGHVKVFCQAIQDRVGFGGEGRDFADARVSGEALQPAHFDLYTEANQTIFAENRAQAGGLAAIAAINRGYGGQGRKLHSSLVELLAEKGQIIHQPGGFCPTWRADTR